MTVEAEKCVLAALGVAFGMATLIFIYLDMQVSGILSITGMLVCRRAMGTTE